jgi:5'-3' exonuclease
MGVKGLYSYLKHYRNYIDPRQAAPKRIGIDAMALLYRFKGDTKEVFQLLDALRKANHILFFVFDGKPPAEKAREVQNRKDQKTAAGEKAESIKTFLGSDAGKTVDTATRDLLEYSLERCTNQSWHMTRETRRAFQEELWTHAIPYVKSVSEADDVLVDMSHAGKIDVVLTTDMDYILGGTKTVWIPTKKDTFFFEEICLADILSGESLTQESLIDAGLLCGTEERAGAKGIPCDKAFTYMRYYGSLEAVLKGNVNNSEIGKMFPDAAAIELARATCKPAADYTSRMRPDHLVRVKEFLDTL